MSLSDAHRMARLRSLHNAAELLGGQHKLAKGLGVGERSVRYWLAGDREIGDGVLTDAAKLLDVHAAACLEEAAAAREAIAGARVIRHRAELVLEAAAIAGANEVDDLAQVTREVAAGSVALHNRLQARSTMRRMKPGSVMTCTPGELAGLEAIRDELGLDEETVRIEASK